MPIDPFDTLESLTEKLASGEVVSLELTEALLDRIAHLNPSIGAYSGVLAVSAMREAAQSDARRSKGKPLGPLDGVPVAVKDLIDTTPAVCGAGLDHLKTYIPDEDATVVKALRDAGAVILGVTESDPGGFSTETLAVHNPVQVDRIAGGSSGGSAAAVAAGLAYAALGTDTGGSIRIPAACCGVYGFKPSYGRVPEKGVRPLAPSLDHVGPIARSVGDLRIIQNAIDPHFAIETPSDIVKEIRVSVPAGVGFAFDETVRQTLIEACKRLEKAGIALKGVELPNGSEILPFHMVNLPVEAAHYHQENFPHDWSDYPSTARKTVEIGLSRTPEDIERAEAARHKTTEFVEALFDDADVLLLPVMPVETPKRGEQTFAFEGRTLSKLEATVWNTSIFNQTGHPVVALTVRPNGHSTPIGLQVVGPLNSDARLVETASHLQEFLCQDGSHGEWLSSRLDDTLIAIQHANRLSSERLCSKPLTIKNRDTLLVDHVSLGVPDISEARKFYDPLLATLGSECSSSGDGYATYGADRTEFLLMRPFDGAKATAGNGSHVGFSARARECVDQFYDTAIKLGGLDEGPPGPRDAYPMNDVYCAYIRDPFGNKIEVIFNGFSMGRS